MKIKINITAINLKYKAMSESQNITLDLGLKDLVTICSSGSKNILSTEGNIVNEPFVLLSKTEFNNLISKTELLDGILNKLKKLSK